MFLSDEIPLYSEVSCFSQKLQLKHVEVRCLDMIDSKEVTAYHDCTQVERVENQHSWHEVLRQSAPIKFELQLFFPSVYFKT